jgi:hypothetical protein
VTCARIRDPQASDLNRVCRVICDRTVFQYLSGGRAGKITVR